MADNAPHHPPKPPKLISPKTQALLEKQKKAKAGAVPSARRRSARPAS